MRKSLGLLAAVTLAGCSIKSTPSAEIPKEQVPVGNAADADAHCVEYVRTHWRSETTDITTETTYLSQLLPENVSEWTVKGSAVLGGQTRTWSCTVLFRGTGSGEFYELVQHPRVEAGILSETSATH